MLYHEQLSGTFRDLRGCGGFCQAQTHSRGERTKCLAQQRQGFWAGLVAIGKQSMAGPALQRCNGEDREIAVEPGS